jgi:hypothetical protein
MDYIVALLRYLKLIEPYLNERKLLQRIGMTEQQIEEVLLRYNTTKELINEDIRV